MEIDFSRYSKIVANDLSLNGTFSSNLGGFSSQWNDSGSDIYFSSGNVGIGTSTPAHLLHLSNDSGATYLHMTCRDSGSSGSNGFSIVQTADNHIYFTQRQNAEMIFSTQNTQRMRITGSNGYVGIGNTAPAALLSVGDDSDHIPFIQGSYNSSYPPLLNVRDDTYNDAGSIAHFSRGASYFQMYSQSFSHKRGSGDMFLMYTSSGNIFIGNASRSKYIKFGTDSTITTVGVDSINSDDRIKYNETDISNCLGIVRQLHAPQRYEKFIPKEENDQIQAFPTDASWNDVKSNDDIHYCDEIGFIAQDIQQIPELSFSVRGQEYDASGNATPLSLEYQNIHNITTGAVKELDAIVQQQQTLIALLEARISALENAN